MSSNETAATVPDQETTRERLKKYGALLTEHPAADVPMPALLCDEPVFAAFRLERQATEAARDRENRMWEEYQQRCANAKAKHDQMVERAAEAGGEWPEPYVQEVWRGRPLAPVQNPFDPHDRSPVNRPGIFWDEKLRGIAAHERAVLIEKRSELLDRVERRKDLKEAQAAREAAQQALAAAEVTCAPFDEAVKLLRHLGESRQERDQRLKEERATRRAAETAQKIYDKVYEAEKPEQEAVEEGTDSGPPEWQPRRISAEAAEIERSHVERDRPKPRRTHRR